MNPLASPVPQIRAHAAQDNDLAIVAMKSYREDRRLAPGPSPTAFSNRLTKDARS